MATFGSRLIGLFIASGALLAIIGFEVIRSAGSFRAATTRATETMDRRDEVGALLSAVRAAQSAQRGFLLTGRDRELADYFAALAGVAQARSVVQSKLVGEDASAAKDYVALVDARLEVLAQVLELRRTEGIDSAIAEVNGGRGVKAMAGVEGSARELMNRQTHRLELQTASSEVLAERLELVAPMAVGLCGLLLAMSFFLTWAEQRRRRSVEAQLNAIAADLGVTAGVSRQLAEDLKRLTEMAELLQTCQSTDEVLVGVRAAFSSLLPQAGGRLALVNDSRNTAAIGAHWGQHSLLAESIFSPEDCWAIRRGQPHPSESGSDGFVCQHVHYPDHHDDDARYWCIPLTAHGGTLGVLTLDFRGVMSENQRHIALAGTDHLSLALANIRLQQDLRTQSIRDPLTGLFNRRYLEAALERDLARATRRGQAVSVLMLDIDHFKKFNDAFGHEAGDHVLAMFGQMLVGKCRGEDTCCRFGGEEFTVVLVDCDAQCAMARAEAIRAGTAQLELSYRGQKMEQITLSIGAATFPHHRQTPQELITAADAALYEAKQSGRNRVREARSDSPAATTP